MEFKVQLTKTDDAVIIANAASKYSADIDVKSCTRHYVVDACSVMGILSLMSDNVVIISTTDVEVGEKLKDDLVKYVVE